MHDKIRTWKYISLIFSKKILENKFWQIFQSNKKCSESEHLFRICTFQCVHFLNTMTILGYTSFYKWHEEFYRYILSSLPSSNEMMASLP